jgi:hypothetical protein
MVLMFSALLALSACGSADNPVQSSAVTTDPAGAAFKNTGQNLASLNGEWRDWAGRDNGIRLVEGSLRVPAPESGENLVIGVERIDQSLQSGAQYTFSVSASSNDAQMLLIYAANNNPVTFVAPSGVAGFYLQVQGGWQASSAADIAATLATSSGGGSGGDGGDGSASGQLSNGGFESGVLAPWENWGGFSVAAGNARNGQYVARIDANTGGGTTFEVTAGHTYSVTASGRRDGSAGSLNLFAKFFDAGWSQTGDQQTASAFGSSWARVTGAGKRALHANRILEWRRWHRLD